MTKDQTRSLAAFGVFVVLGLTLGWYWGIDWTVRSPEHGLGLFLIVDFAALFTILATMESTK